MRTFKGSVAVGLSGGVDYAVAAWRLKQEGWRVIGLTMSIWDGSLPIPDLGLSGCFGPGEARDLAAAREMAARLGIEHRVISLASEYRETVLSYFREEYLAGRTPNPCAVCNQRMKFGFLLEQARAQGVAFDKFATGHYARVGFDEASQRWQLRRGRDENDQSYFISFNSNWRLRFRWAITEGRGEIARENGMTSPCVRRVRISSNARLPVLFRQDAAPGDVVTRDTARGGTVESFTTPRPRKGWGGRGTVVAGVDARNGSLSGRAKNYTPRNWRRGRELGGWAVASPWTLRRSQRHGLARRSAGGRRLQVVFGRCLSARPDSRVPSGDIVLLGVIAKACFVVGAGSALPGARRRE